MTRFSAQSLSSGALAGANLFMPVTGVLFFTTKLLNLICKDDSTQSIAILSAVFCGMATLIANIAVMTKYFNLGFAELSENPQVLLDINNSIFTHSALEILDNALSDSAGLPKRATLITGSLLYTFAMMKHKLFHTDDRNKSEAYPCKLFIVLVVSVASLLSHAANIGPSLEDTVQALGRMRCPG